MKKINEELFSLEKDKILPSIPFVTILIYLLFKHTSIITWLQGEMISELLSKFNILLLFWSVLVVFVSCVFIGTWFNSIASLILYLLFKSKFICNTLFKNSSGENDMDLNNKLVKSLTFTISVILSFTLLLLLNLYYFNGGEKFLNTMLLICILLSIINIIALILMPVCNNKMGK